MISGCHFIPTDKGRSKSGDFQYGIIHWGKAYFLYFAATKTGCTRSELPLPSAGLELSQPHGIA